ncbi:sensor domain-containing protein [Streptomyces sp. MS1.AVA.1]|uniref:Sensor domain-containing protein n=1 Tax=Streptomyces machairae TaxID=3134109 RepID=A0ABU8ULR5_9ACTN
MHRPPDHVPDGIPDKIRGFSVAAGLVGLRHALALCWTASAAFGRSLAVSGAIWLVGPGLGMVPRAMEGVRNLAARRRELALRWSGVDIPGPPGPLPPAPEGASGLTGRYRWIMSDPQTRREYVWVLTDPLAGAFFAFFPIALVLSGAWASSSPSSVSGCPPSGTACGTTSSRSRAGPPPYSPESSASCNCRWPCGRRRGRCAGTPCTPARCSPRARAS